MEEQRKINVVTSVAYLVDIELKLLLYMEGYLDCMHIIGTKEGLEMKVMPVVPYFSIYRIRMGDDSEFTYGISLIDYITYR